MGGPPLVFCLCKGGVKLIDLRSGRSSGGVKEGSFRVEGDLEEMGA